MPIQQETIHYSTYIKQALVEGMRAVFATHVDEILTRTKVDVEFPLDRASYPAVIIRFFEREATNLGVGHREWIPELDQNGAETGFFIKYKNYYYTGDIEFAIYALSSYDRDLLGDSIMQTLTMGELTAYTNNFFQHIYDPDRIVAPESDDTFLNLNTDRVQGFGESQVQAPWLPEDVLVYQKSYRVGITGQFYSLTPDNEVYGLVQKVNEWPYLTDLEPKPSGTQSTPGWADDFSTNHTADYTFASPSGYATALTLSGGDLNVTNYLAISPPITVQGDLQIDTHFTWDGSTDAELAYYWHTGSVFGSQINAQHARIKLDPDPANSVYVGRTNVQIRPGGWVEAVRSAIDNTGLANINLWWRLKVEGFKFTSEIWLADPKVSLKTKRIFRTAYIMTPEERVSNGGKIWTEHRNITIRDWTVTTPDLAPWVSGIDLTG